MYREQGWDGQNFDPGWEEIVGASAASDGEQGLNTMAASSCNAAAQQITNTASSAAAFRTLLRVPVFFGAATQIRSVRRQHMGTYFVDNMDGLCRVSYRTTTGGVRCVPLMGPIAVDSTGSLSS